MLSYEINVHCICGEIKKYTLNALRSQIVILGRESQNQEEYPKINLCGDDDNYLSRTEIYFAFDVDDKDWVVGTGFPLEKYWKYDKDIEQIGRTMMQKEFKDKSYVIENNKFNSLLADVVNNKVSNNEKAISENLYDNIAMPIQKDRPVRLEKLSGVVIVPVNKNKPFKYNGEIHTGIKHPILPTIPFHWFIEIKNNRTNTIAIKSYIEKTKYLSKE